MLVTQVEASFFKKATGMIHFSCTEGKMINEAVERAVEHSSPQTIKVKSSGYNASGELIAEFFFTWSVKRRN